MQRGGSRTRIVDVPAGEVVGVEAMRKHFLFPRQIEGALPSLFHQTGLITTAQPLAACTAAGVEFVIISEEEESIGSSSNLSIVRVVL